MHPLPDTARSRPSRSAEGPVPAGIIRRCVFKCSTERIGRLESAGRRKLAVPAEDRGMERPEHRVADRFTVGGDQTAMESGILRVMTTMGLSNRLAHRAVTFRRSASRRVFVSDRSWTECSIEQQGKRGLARAVGSGQRPGAPAGPDAATAATRSTTSSARAVTMYPSSGSGRSTSRSRFAERAKRPRTEIWSARMVIHQPIANTADGDRASSQVARSARSSERAHP